MVCCEETREVLRAFSDATGMAGTFHPADGNTAPCNSEDREGPVFCRLVSERLREKGPCRAALSRGVEDAAKSRKPQFLRCFAGLRHVVVPVFNGAGFVGSLLVGQIKDRPHKKGILPQISKRLRALGLDAEVKALLKAYSKVPVTTAHRFEAAVRLATALSGQIANTLKAGEAQLGTQAYCVEQMTAFADDHYLTADCNLRAVAKHLGFSDAYLCRAFHARTGQTFTHHVTSRRIEHAKASFVQKHLRVVDIAFDCGFASISQFNRAFKMETGVTPTAWRMRVL